MALLLRHLLPLPVPLLLAFLLAASSNGAPPGNDSYDTSLCLWQPTPCGNVTIDYPFYPYGKTADILGSPISYCGYPGLAIHCEDDKAILRLGGDNNYTVSGIDYNNLTLTVADQFEDESCPRVDHNLTLPDPETSWLTYPSDTVDYLVFFLNCQFPSGFPGLPDTNSITCQIYDGSMGGGLSFVLLRDDVPAGDWKKYCKVFEVPVLKSVLSQHPIDYKWRDGGYGDALRTGFQLMWEQKNSSCDPCERSKGRCAYNPAMDFVGCLCSGGRVDPHGCSSGHRMKTPIYIVAITSCLLLLCLIILALYLTHKNDSLCFKTKDAPRIESFLQKNGNIHPKRYTYAEVKRMTKSFALKLGQGGFGAVYRGNLADGREVAVKMLKDNKGDGEEFMNEVSSISRTSHVNVVTLLGFCLQGSKRALIYEYMPNGSLERGLEYLHRGCNTRIVHFDIKPHNILLDQDFCPKISDFGLAKLCLNKESVISIAGARGTIGYIAPEVYSKQFGTVSSKSDVYSYGMMVLVMVGARDKNTNASSESSSQYFPQWIYDHLDDYCVSASEINGETTELVRKMIVVGLWCIQINPTLRPTMTTVVEMLEGSTSTLEPPPKILLT